MSNFWFAFGLTLFAGLATGIGSIIAFFAHRTNYRFLSISTGFSAGVMLYVSFVEILFKGSEALAEVYGEYWGAWINTASFFGGIFIIALIDNLIPAAENPHELPSQDSIADLRDEANPLLETPAPIAETGTTPPAAQSSAVAPAAAAAGGANVPPHNKKLMRMGLFTALAIAIHNFPEGLATFLAALHDPTLGIAIAIAVALHNIPEGISVSVPIYYATGDRKKAFIYSFLSGMAEPVGALIAYFGLLMVFGSENGFPQQVLGILFGGVAGIMVYISIDELLPTSRAYGKGHDSLLGLLAGMGVMALSLLLMM